MSTGRDEAILARFVVEGRILALPAARGRRQVILEHVVRAFVPGVDYTEADVDTVLRAFHPALADGRAGRVPMDQRLAVAWDVTTLRRYLIDAGLLSREAGRYWRSGGDFDVDEGR